MLFSIIMCTYNSAHTLKYAVDSVCRQSYADWELVILDNGSSDMTVELLQEYQKEDKRIRCFSSQIMLDGVRESACV